MSRRNEVLDKAIELVEVGWCKGKAWRDTADGREVCAQQALTEACFATQKVCQCRAISDDIKARTGLRVSMWNDQRNRTKQDIVKMFTELKDE